MLLGQGSPLHMRDDEKCDDSLDERYMILYRATRWKEDGDR